MENKLKLPKGYAFASFPLSTGLYDELYHKIYSGLDNNGQLVWVGGKYKLKHSLGRKKPEHHEKTIFRKSNLKDIEHNVILKASKFDNELKNLAVSRKNEFIAFLISALNDAANFLYDKPDYTLNINLENHIHAGSAQVDTLRSLVNNLNAHLNISVEVSYKNIHPLSPDTYFYINLKYKK